MLLERLNRQLADYGRRDLRRELKPAHGIDFTSNDYLGLARHPALIAVMQEALGRGEPVGSGGSRLLRGNHPEHEELEARAARFFGSESALYFASGFDANLALFSALPTRRDAVVYDERVHASVKEGVRASFAKKRAFRHNDVSDLEKCVAGLRDAGAKDIFIAVESIYSMDGDIAPLFDILAAAERLDATVVLDEAHATGVFGAGGRGLSEGLGSRPLIAVHTCGKALGSSGALIALPVIVKDYLIQTARPFLYSTAPSPMLAKVVMRALDLVEDEPWRRQSLLALARFAAEEFARVFPGSGAASGTQILPLVIGGAGAANAAAEFLQRRGFDVRALRPPTVPEGSSRLRISLSVERTREEIRALAKTLAELPRPD